MNNANFDTVESSQFILKTKVCHDSFFKLKRHTIQYDKFDGSKSKIHNLEVLVREPTIAILLYDKTQHSILLTEQFRVGPLENEDIKTHIIPFDDAVGMLKQDNLSVITGLAIMWLKANKIVAREKYNVH